MPWLCSQPTPSYIARNSFAFSCFPEFLNVSYFYERAQSHETIVDCDIDSISVSGQLPIYPSPNPILTLTCYQLAVVECGGGGGGVWTERETIWRHFGSPKVLHVPNLDKCSLAYGKIVNLKCSVRCWLRKGSTKSQLHREKLFRVLLYEILACFIFLWTCADARGNCWLWEKFGFLHKRFLLSRI